MSELQFASWAELGQIPIVDLTLPALGKRIQYLKYVPFDKLIAFQLEYRHGKSDADIDGYTRAVLRYVMVNPPIKSDAEMTAAMHAIGPIIMRIVLDATSLPDGEVVETAKNSLSSSSVAAS